jgi:hypothetical protein
MFPGLWLILLPGKFFVEPWGTIDYRKVGEDLLPWIYAGMVPEVGLEPT